MAAIANLMDVVMVFSSLLFIFVFLPFSLALFYAGTLLAKQNKQVFCSLLIALSLTFYFWGSGKLVLLLVLSILFNWYVGRSLAHLESGSKRKALLVTGICINLSALLYFKYCRFFLDALGIVSNTVFLPDLHPYLPVGISFYTFMTISYLVEVYSAPRQKASLLEFGTYLSLFPHLVAGPIVRFSELATDLRKHSLLSVDNFFAGIVRFAQGLAMKVLIADNLSPLVDSIFALEPATLTSGAAWLGAFAYTFQIYFDFAGYSAMAIGIALMFGFHFPENFNRPYIAASVTEFWQRWHMSLSRWLRDYIYIPLGGNRKGNIRTYLNLFAVFFICGLWHGAAWTFVVWGLYQGILLIVERILKNNIGFQATGIVGSIVTFFLIMIGWVMFRSVSFSHCGYYLKTMFGISETASITNLTTQVMEYLDPLAITVLILAMIISFTPVERLMNKIKTDGSLYWIGQSVLTACLLLLSSLYLVGSSFQPFIYFRF